ncbi:DUF6355 family natural product biosynthesis protein [Lentzea sp. BCCO 10_0798]|uniref:DUF6355 family natural product biosynthesis protein n=1 Tax=Lentzea kristufekii TaxID=3095430 RepID=A0ABU4TZW0_9PSEU|nr:DUF6355 family natural product biosynthesis protein [Lentzea sp. BCCO 10_0798]MDX8053801.1 DUF6355 family natural product biosynthesis protein [Lentzea sp. BCCO 10_0798]
MNANIARAFTAAGMLLAATAVGMIDTPSNTASAISPRPCGFYSLDLPQGEQTGGYVHCGDGFILIKFHWSTGTTGTSCIPPWGSRPFFKDGPHKIVNAYYVPTRPNLSGPPGNQMCSTGQPRA